MTLLITLLISQSGFPQPPDSSICHNARIAAEEWQPLRQWLHDHCDRQGNCESDQEENDFFFAKLSMAGSYSVYLEARLSTASERFRWIRTLIRTPRLYVMLAEERQDAIRMRSAIGRLVRVYRSIPDLEVCQ